MFIARAESTAKKESSVLIENVTVISSDTKNTRIFKGYVLVHGKRIVYVGKKKPKVTRNATIIDGENKYIIPGLIDSHTHLANVAGMSWKLNKKYPQFAKDYYKQLPKSYLYFGYTTLIDANNHSPKILESILNAEIRPTVFTCGEQLEVMNGFMMAETPRKDRYKSHPNFVNDRYNKNTVIKEGISLEKHTPKASIKRILRKQNGKCVKIAFENGFGGTEKVTWEMPSKQIISEVVKEARKENIPVLLHANSYESQQFAYDTGVDIIAHGMWHWGPIKKYLTIKELPNTHASLLRNIAKKRIGYQPTFRVIAGQRDVFDDKFINDKNLEHVYPKAYLNWLKTEEGHWQQTNIKKYAKGFFDGKSNSEIVPFMQQMVDKISLSSKVLADENANLLLGTDTPASNSHSNPPGYNGYLEMREWFKAGISLKQIFMAATINNAKAFNIADSYGSVEKGKIANLLLLEKNPLQDISAYDNIQLVILNGRILRRKNLSARTY